MKLKREVPPYFQSPRDYACGPKVIHMVADSFRRERGTKLLATEWIEILDITMKGNVFRKTGTEEEDLKKALRYIGFTVRELDGKSYDEKTTSVIESLDRNNPVIVRCLLNIKGEKHPHYAIVVEVDEKKYDVYLRDPYPHNKRRQRRPRHIPKREFEKGTAERGETVWGPKRWGIEVSF